MLATMIHLYEATLCVGTSVGTRASSLAVDSCTHTRVPRQYAVSPVWCGLLSSSTSDDTEAMLHAYCKTCKLVLLVHRDASVGSSCVGL
jgi:hypothetical protein